MFRPTYTGRREAARAALSAAEGCHALRGRRRPPAHALGLVRLQRLVVRRAAEAPLPAEPSHPDKLGATSTIPGTHDWESSVARSSCRPGESVGFSPGERSKDQVGMRGAPTADGSRGRVRETDWSAAKLGDRSEHGLTRRAPGRGAYAPRSSFGAFDRLLFARLDRAGCAPYNGPPISGESALEGFAQPTPVGAKPHEPPAWQPKAATPYAGGGGRPRTP